MAAEAKATVVAYLVWERVSYGYVHARAEIAWSDDDERFPRGSRWEDEKRELEGLQITSQGNDTGGHHTEYDGQLYGWQPGFVDTKIDSSERAAQLVKVLRKLESGLAKANEADGCAASFTQYLRRVLRTLGVARCAWKLTPEQAERHGAAVKYGTVGEGMNWLDYRIDDWRGALKDAGAKLAA